MKSISLRFIFVTSICVASFCSFLYLNFGAETSQIISEVDSTAMYSMEADSSETIFLLPDLQMLENVIERGKSHLKLISRF